MSKHPPRKYDWFGYGCWFAFGMVQGAAVLFILHFAIETAFMSGWQIVGILSACCLAGGFWWGRKHRLQWEQENNEGELADEILGRHRDDS